MALTIPHPISIARFVPPAEEPTYSQIFADTLGNAATDSDGIAAGLSDMAALSDSALALDPLLGHAVASVDALRTALPTGRGAALNAALASAVDKGNQTFGKYAQLVPPVSSPTPPVGPPQEPTPTPAPTPTDCTPPAGQIATVLPTMKLGDPPADILIDNEQIPESDPGTLSLNLQCGDNAVFHVHTVVTFIPNPGFAPLQNRDLLLTVTPSKVGTWGATVRERDATLRSGLTFPTYWQVTVTN